MGVGVQGCGQLGAAAREAAVHAGHEGMKAGYPGAEEKEMMDLVSVISHGQHMRGLVGTAVQASPVRRSGAGLCARGVGVTKPPRSWLIIFAIALPGSQRTGYLVLLRSRTCLHFNKGVGASLQLEITKCWVLFLRCNRENLEYRSLIHNSDTSLIQATGKRLNTEACGLIIYLWLNWV